MTTKKHVSHSATDFQSASSSVEAIVSTTQPAVAASPVAAPAAPVVSVPASAMHAAAQPTALGSTAITPAPVVYLTPPPSNALIPAVPSYFVPDSGTAYRGITPKKAELITLPLALADLKKFTNYTEVVGSTAPPYAEILAIFDVTNQWSSMRTGSSAWDVFCRDQEGICWTVMRPAMESLKATFDLAVARDPSLAAKLPGLAALLGVKQAIAKKGASTRRANRKAVAEGKEPTHGVVGKQRVKAADKAIVAAANAPAPVANAPAPVATAPVQSAPVQVAMPPVVVMPAPVAQPSNGASATGATVTNGAAAGGAVAGH